jgi:hypothetical protein
LILAAVFDKIYQFDNLNLPHLLSKVAYGLMESSILAKDVRQQEILFELARL